MVSYKQRESCLVGKIILWQSYYIHNGISYTGKMTTFYRSWILVYKWDFNLIIDTPYIFPLVIYETSIVQTLENNCLLSRYQAHSMWSTTYNKEPKSSLLIANMTCNNAGFLISIHDSSLQRQDGRVWCWIGWSLKQITTILQMTLLNQWLSARLQ